MVYFPLLSFVVIYWGNRPEPLQLRGPDIKPFAIVFQGPLIHYLPTEITRSESLLPSQKKYLLSKPVKPLSLFDFNDSKSLFKSVHEGLAVSGSLPDKDIFQCLYNSVYHLPSVTDYF